MTRRRSFLRRGALAGITATAGCLGLFEEEYRAGDVVVDNPTDKSFPLDVKVVLQEKYSTGSETTDSPGSGDLNMVVEDYSEHIRRRNQQQLFRITIPGRHSIRADNGRETELKVVEFQPTGTGDDPVDGPVVFLTMSDRGEVTISTKSPGA